MSKFDDQLQSLIDSGSISENDAAALRDASPLKAERDEARAAADAANTRARVLEAKAATDVFTKLAIPGTPDAYKLPDTVDVTDETQVRSWAQSMSLLPAAGPTAEEQAAHERMAAATSGASAPVPSPVGDKVADLRKQIMRAGATQLDPGGDLYNQAVNALREAGHTFDSVPHDTNFERIPEWGSTKA